MENPTVCTEWGNSCEAHVVVLLLFYIRRLLTCVVVLSVAYILVGCCSSPDHQRSFSMYISKRSTEANKTHLFICSMIVCLLCTLYLCIITGVNIHLEKLSLIFNISIWIKLNDCCDRVFDGKLECTVATVKYTVHTHLLFCLSHWRVRRRRRWRQLLISATPHRELKPSFTQTPNPESKHLTNTMVTYAVS